MAETQFSVDGINSLKSEMINEREMSQRSRQAVKNQEQIIRKIEKNHEKMIKNEEQRMMRILVMKIQRRFAAFPWLAEKVPHITARTTLMELKETDELQKLELDLQGAEQRLVSMIKQGSYFVEGFWGDGTKMTFLPPQARLDLRNFGKIINSDVFMKEAQPLIVETTIEYPSIGQMSLPLRWISCFFNAMIMVHQMNTNVAFRKMMEGKAEEFASEEEVDEDETKNAK